MVRSSSDFFEIDPFDHGQPLEMAAQTVEAHLDRAQAHPLATADDAAAPGGDLLVRRDRQANGASELDPVRAFVEIDQDRQRMRDAGQTPRATISAVSRVIPPAVVAPSRPTAAHTSLSSRATTPRRKTFSAPGRWATRAAIWPPVNVSTTASEPW